MKRHRSARPGLVLVRAFGRQRHSRCHELRLAINETPRVRVDVAKTTFTIRVDLRERTSQCGFDPLSAIDRTLSRGQL
jgi:hypothetical protein